MMGYMPQILLKGAQPEYKYLKTTAMVHSDS